MSVPSVLMQLSLDGGVTYTQDISGFVRRQASISVKRGRNTERANPENGTLTFTVDNRDGRFTIGKTSGPYGSAWKKGLPIRYTAAGSIRFTGFLQSAPVQMVNGRVLSDVTVTCVDCRGIMLLAPISVSWADALISSTILKTYWWKLDAPSIATTAAEQFSTLPLVGSLLTAVGHAPTSTYALADCVKFGENPPDGIDTNTQVFLTQQDDGTGGILSTSGLSWSTNSGTKDKVHGLMYTPGADALPDQQVIVKMSGTNGTGTDIFNITRIGWDLVMTESHTAYGTASVTFPHFFSANTPAWIFFTLNRTANIYTTAGLQSGFTRPFWTAGQTTTPTFTSLQLGPANGLYAHLTLGGANTGFDLSQDYGPLLTLMSALFGVGSGSVLYWMQRTLNVAGMTATPALLAAAGVQRYTERPQLKGSNPAEVGDSLANSCGGMFVAARDGTPTFIDPTYCPTRVDLSTYDWQRDLTSDSDDSLYFTRVDIDGKVAADSGRTPPAGIDIPGLLPQPGQDAYASFLANSSDIWSGPRTAQIKINLMAKSDALRDKYLALDLRSRIYAADVPAVFPPAIVQTIEGCTETLTEKDWMFIFNAAPDPSLVWEDDVSGLWESDYRAGP